MPSLFVSLLFPSASTLSQFYPSFYRSWSLLPDNDCDYPLLDDDLVVLGPCALAGWISADGADEIVYRELRSVLKPLRREAGGGGGLRCRAVGA